MRLKKQLLAATLFGREEPHAWTNRTIVSTGAWRSVAWSPPLAKLAAVGYQNGSPTYSIATSDDGGVTWVGKTPPGGEPTVRQFEHVIWAGGNFNKYIAGANNPDGNRILTSTDGEIWNAVAGPPAGVIRLAASSTVVVALVTGGGIWYSTNLTSWTSASTTPSIAQNAVVWVEELSLFVSVGPSGGASSPDGNTWTDRVMPAKSFVDVAWSKKLAILVAVASNGDTASAASSANGTAWTSRTTPNLQYWEAVAASGDDADTVGFCAVGSDGASNYAMTSANGTSWTSRTPSFSGATAVPGIAYPIIFERFCVVGYTAALAAKCATSTTGT